MFTKKNKPTAQDVALINIKNITDDDVEAATDVVRGLYLKLGGSDQIAKGPDLRKAVESAVKATLKTTKNH